MIDDFNTLITGLLLFETNEFSETVIIYSLQSGRRSLGGNSGLQSSKRLRKGFGKKNFIRLSKTP